MTIITLNDNFRYQMHQMISHQQSILLLKDLNFIIENRAKISILPLNKMPADKRRKSCNNIFNFRLF